MEAELRRRMQAGGAQDVPPPTEFALPSANGQVAPATGAPVEAHAEKKTGIGEWIARLGPIGILLLAVFGKLKFLLPVAKFIVPALQTGGTMLLSIFVYAQRGGWPFAVGFVLSIFVHEMGHVLVAWRMGVPVSAPLFIPGFGALILQKQAAKSAWDEALIGIGGPVGGTLAALACLAAYGATGYDLMLHLAYVGFFINLFNLAPVFPLDGGWITGAISPRIWLIGLVGMVAAFLTGLIRNPLILVLVLLSLPRLWHGLKTGDVTPHGGVPVTPRQRVTMAVAYVGLASLLFWLISVTHRPI